MPTEAVGSSDERTVAEVDGPGPAPVVGAVIAGALMAGQSRMNGEMSRITGEPIQTALYSFGSGLVLLTLAVLLLPSIRQGLARVRQAWRDGTLAYRHSVGGLLGALFVAVQAFAVPAVGVALFTVASIGGQTANALAVDRLGIGGAPRRAVAPGRIVAALLALVGVAVTMAPRLGGGDLVLLPVLLAVLVGGGQAVQQATNVRVNLASRHLLSTTWLNFVVGTGLLALIALGAYLLGELDPTSLAGVPWWAFLGGILGIGFIAIAAWAVNHLGVFVYTLPMLTGYLGTAVLLDLVHPEAGHEVSAVVLVGVGITFASAVLAAVLARPRRA